MSLSLIFPQCNMLNLRKGYVSCHYIFTPLVAFKLYTVCRIKKEDVALAILGVNGHKIARLRYYFGV